MQGRGSAKPREKRAVTAHNSASPKHLHILNPGAGVQSTTLYLPDPAFDVRALINRCALKRKYVPPFDYLLLDRIAILATGKSNGYPCAIKWLAMNFGVTHWKVEQSIQRLSQPYIGRESRALLLIFRPERCGKAKRYAVNRELLEDMNSLSPHEGDACRVCRRGIRQ